MGTYPIVVRNNVPIVQRGFMLLFCGILLIVAWKAWAERPPDETRLWPWLLSLFWIVGVFAVRRSFGVEAGRLTLQGPRHARVERGPPFSRRSQTLARLDLDIVDTRDGDDDPYFHLIVDTPSSPLIIAESHDRAALLALKERLERAWGAALIPKPIPKA